MTLAIPHMSVSSATTSSVAVIDHTTLSPTTIAYIGIGVVAALESIPPANRDAMVERFEGQLGIVEAAIIVAAAHAIDAIECDGVHAYEVAEIFGCDFVHDACSKLKAVA